MRRLCSCPIVSALSVLCIIILCGNNEPKRSCRYFAAFRVRIGCTFRMASLCASVFSATDYGGVTKNSGAMLVLAWDKEKKNLMVVPKLILPERAVAHGRV